MSPRTPRRGETRRRATPAAGGGEVERPPEDRDPSALIARLPVSETPEQHFSAGGMRPRSWSVGPGTHFPLHRHERTKHLFVTRGSISFNGMPWAAPAGMVIPAGLAHEAEAGEDGVECVEAFA